MSSVSYIPRTIFFVAVLFLCTCPALAGCPAGYDVLGVWTSPDCGDEHMDLGGPQQFSVYVVLSHGTAETLVGVEFSLAPAPANMIFFLSAILPPGAINIGSFPDFIIGLPSPMFPSANPALQLFEVQFFYIGTSDEVLFYLDETTSPAIPGEIVYQEDDEQHSLHPMKPSSGSFDLPVFGINTGPLFGESVNIVTDPVGLDAPWSLDFVNGPFAGVGAATWDNMPAGSDTLTWGTVPEWIFVGDPVQSGYLPIGGELTFTGQYVLPTGPQIASISDIPADQGRQVRITWSRSYDDQEGTDYTITGYGIYRRQDERAAGKAKYGSRLDGWDYIETVPARGDEIYQYVAPTLCDSTINEGVCWSAFMVSAMTDDPLVYFDSPPDSGYSVDNLAPIAPQSFQVDFSRYENVLSWAAPDDPDVDHYLVYRDDAIEPLAEVFGLNWTDTLDGQDEVGWDYRYALVAVDHSGNRSEATEWEQTATTGAGEPTLPMRYALHPCTPNPFNPRTTIRYDLPGTAHARVTVFAVDGRQIAVLVDESQTAGTHAVVWNGKNAAGRSVASGTYFYRLESGSFSQTRRMVLLK